MADSKTLPPVNPTIANMNVPIMYLEYIIMSGSQMYKYYVSRNKKRSIDKIITKVNR